MNPEEAATSTYDGTDYVCDNCGCEIMVKHSGDHEKHTTDAYTCRCGTQMRLEHARAGAL